jgi:hypothetical protein
MLAIYLSLVKIIYIISSILIKMVRIYNQEVKFKGNLI